MKKCFCDFCEAEDQELYPFIVEGGKVLKLCPSCFYSVKLNKLLKPNNGGPKNE